MNKLSNFALMGALSVIAMLVQGCATTTAQPQVENMLSAAGFQTKIASTPQQLQHLKAIPPGKITAVKRKGKTYFVYPDPAHNQIYVGNQSQYQAYQQMRLAKQLAAQDVQAAEWDAYAGTTGWDAWGFGY
jgi:hypothetical protein